MADAMSRSAVFVRALYSYNGADSTSLSFRQGDVIEVLSTLESGWWDGVILQTGVRGWFPSNYVEYVSEAEALWTTRPLDPRYLRAASHASGFSGSDDNDYNSMLAQLISTGSTAEEAPIHDLVRDRNDDSTSFSSGGDIFSEIAAVAQANYATERTQSVSSALGATEDAGNDWEAHTTPAGNHFWFNRRTGETSQSRPGQLGSRDRAHAYHTVHESSPKEAANVAPVLPPTSSNRRMSASDDSDDSDLDTAFAKPRRRARNGSDSGITRDFARRFDVVTPRPPPSVDPAEEESTPLLADLEDAAISTLTRLTEIAGKRSPEPCNSEAVLELGERAVARVRDALQASSALDHGLLEDLEAEDRDRAGLPAAAVAQLRPAYRQVISALSKLSFGLRALRSLPETSAPDNSRFDDARDDESPSDEGRRARRQAAHAEQAQPVLEVEARSLRDIVLSSQAVSERLSLFFQHLRGALVADRPRRGLPPLPIAMLRAPYSLEVRLRATPRSIPAPWSAANRPAALSPAQGLQSLADRIATVAQNLRAVQRERLPLSAVAHERLLHLRSLISELLAVTGHIDATVASASLAPPAVGSDEIEQPGRSELLKLRHAAAGLRDFMPSVLLAVQSASERDANRSDGDAPGTEAARSDLSLTELVEHALEDVKSLSSTVPALSRLLQAPASLAVPLDSNTPDRPQSLAAPSLDGSVNTPTSSSTAAETHRSRDDASFDRTMATSVRNSVDSDFFFSGATTNELHQALPQVESDGQLAPEKASPLQTSRDPLVGGTASSASSGSGIEVLRSVPAVPHGWDDTRRGSTATWSTTSSRSYASPRSGSFPAGLDHRSSTRSSSKNIHKLLGEVPPEAIMREQPQAVPWYLERDWDDDDLSFTMDHTIRGGTLRGLVIAATSHEGRGSFCGASIML